MRNGLTGTTTLFDALVANQRDCLVWSGRGFRTHAAAGMAVHGLVRSCALADSAYGPDDVQPVVVVQGLDGPLPTQTWASAVWREDLAASTLHVDVTWDAMPAVTGWRFVWPAAGLDAEVTWSAAEQEEYAAVLAGLAHLQVVGN